MATTNFLDGASTRSDNPIRHMIWGPMFSGKSTELLAIRSRLRHAEVPFLLAKPTIDTRSGSPLVSSHDGAEAEAEEFDSAQAMVQRVAELEVPVLLVDEAQFFTDLPAALDTLFGMGVHVFMAALNSTFRGEPWPAIVAVLHTCHVQQTQAVCKRCKSHRAIHSQKVSDREAGSDNILIGSDAEYEARCLRCFTP